MSFCEFIIDHCNSPKHQLLKSGSGWELARCHKWKCVSIGDYIVVTIVLYHSAGGCAIESSQEWEIVVVHNAIVVDDAIGCDKRNTTIHREDPTICFSERQAIDLRIGNDPGLNPCGRIGPA